MPQYLAPGVYVEEVSFRAPSIEGVGTSTAAFVGPTLTGPVKQTPELLTSFGDFQNIYGGFSNLAITGNPSDAKNTNYMSLSVQAFFSNGGSELYVSRVYAPKGGSDTGIAAAGTTSATTVSVSARFPGAYGNQPVIVALNAVKTQNVSGLPTGSLLAVVPPGGAAIATLEAAAGAGDLTITVAPPYTGLLPAFVAVDSEIMSVTAVDGTKTILTVTRGVEGSTAAGHAINAPIYPAIASVVSAILATDTQVTVTPAISGSLAAGTFPGSLQIDEEQVTVTAVDPTGTILTITRGAHSTTAAAHAAKAPVFAPATVAFYTNGTTSTFSNAQGNLPSSAPPNTYVLTMKVTASGASGSPQVYDGLGFDPAHPNYLGTALAATPPRHIDALENQVAFNIGSSLTPVTLYGSIFGASGTPLTNNSFTYWLKNGDDGVEPSATDYANALTYLTALEDVAIVAAPGSGIFNSSQDIINDLITHVSQQRAYRIAILETPPNQIASDNENVRAQIDSSYAALYVPWVLTPNPLAVAGSSTPAEIAVPPSGFMAGIYARSDSQNGVAKAPANEVVLGASRFERNITFNEQQLLNPLGINCLRYFPNRGYLVWGARTATSDSEFMYVNVRRYLIYLEHSIDNSTQWAVFENNGPALWARVKESIDSFLYNEWKEGSLLGDSASQAYFVRCDRTTMTQNDLDNGRMICLIGVALLKPAEFVIFRIGQMTAGSQS
ncbi:MAG TPA: phage tail sheath subtilisin-like domain-containing protein [Bryobacteraceae bacterium]|nr:phage tail sheath subtilisin-like domain-containing protein [Bryobacteraceae bacterium]